MHWRSYISSYKWGAYFLNLRCGGVTTRPSWPILLQGPIGDAGVMVTVAGLSTLVQLAVGRIGVRGPHGAGRGPGVAGVRPGTHIEHINASG